MSLQIEYKLGFQVDNLLAMDMPQANISVQGEVPRALSGECIWKKQHYFLIVEPFFLNLIFKNHMCMWHFFSYSVSGGSLLYWQIRLWGYGTNAAQHDSKCFQKYHSFKFQTKENVL